MDREQTRDPSCLELEDRHDSCFKTEHCQHDYCIEAATSQDLTDAHSSIHSHVDKTAPALVKHLGILDRFLVVWILLAMIIGVLIGYYVPSVQSAFETVQFGSVSLPIAIGMLLMMYPVLCKVQYERLPMILSRREIWVQIALSVFINWIVGPIVMTALAWATLPDLPGFRTGVVMVGLARCIAMVMIWNQVAGGDDDYCAILVAINAILQIALFSPYAILFISLVPSWFGAAQDETIQIQIWTVAQSVLIYLGIPLLAGALTRFVFCVWKGKVWYDTRALPYLDPFALIGLIYIIIILFANQGHSIITHIGSVFRVAVPLIVYFILLFFITFGALKACGFRYALVTTQSFTAASNNFELAIAVAVGTFGIQSEQALAASIGPLTEVPVLLALAYLALFMKKRLRWKDAQTDLSHPPYA